MSTPPVFDPMLVPVALTDHHLPKVSGHSLNADSLRQRFATPREWTPEVLSEPRFSSKPLRDASVLVPLVMREELMVLLTQRTTNLSSHSGQIAFPGGMADAEDIDATATALREAYEEIGLLGSHVAVIGALPVYATGSAFLVTPVIALVQPTIELQINPDEVADVFEIPLAFLMDPSNHRHHEVEWAGAKRRWLSMPYKDGEKERFVWGATAGMLRNLYRFLLD
jgi:8-oxo-dGTP pyrophosphatase MutT (NUDIX family)